MGDVSATHINEILPCVFLSDAIAASSLVNNDGSPLGVTHCLNVADTVCYLPFKTRLVLEMVPFDDFGRTFVTKSHFEKCFSFIEEALEQNAENRVVVHCRAGVNRSAMIMVAYVMFKKDLDWKAAHDFVKERRKGIDIVEPYKRVLQQYSEGKLPKDDSAKPNNWNAKSRRFGF
eukprot:Lithocolla_globosa_v1_NODE_8900_length_769_cov_13.140056.p1 type:complete len:175 gc:universal NODE_8900_length_769_cov_13.140056:82-606(+)